MNIALEHVCDGLNRVVDNPALADNIAHFDRVRNVGFSLESYHALEELCPGIFEGIDPRKLTAMPSRSYQKQAIVAIESNGLARAVLEIAGSALVGGAIGYIIGWVISRIKQLVEGGGGGGGGGGFTRSGADTKGPLFTFTVSGSMRDTARQMDFNEVVIDDVKLAPFTAIDKDLSKMLHANLTLTYSLYVTLKDDVASKVTKINKAIGPISACPSFYALAPLCTRKSVSGSMLTPVLVPELGKINWPDALRDLATLMDALTALSKTNKITVEKAIDDIEKIVKKMENHLGPMKRVENQFTENRAELGASYSLLPENGQFPPSKSFNKLDKGIEKYVQTTMKAADAVAEFKMKEYMLAAEGMKKNNNIDKIIGDDESLRPKLKRAITAATSALRVYTGCITIAMKTQRVYGGAMASGEAVFEVNKVRMERERARKEGEKK